jgi:hypothetical protein
MVGRAAKGARPEGTTGVGAAMAGSSVASGISSTGVSAGGVSGSSGGEVSLIFLVLFALASVAGASDGGKACVSVELEDPLLALDGLNPPKEGEPNLGLPPEVGGEVGPATEEGGAVEFAAAAAASALRSARVFLGGGLDPSSSSSS